MIFVLIYIKSRWLTQHVWQLRISHSHQFQESTRSGRFLSSVQFEMVSARQSPLWWRGERWVGGDAAQLAERRTGTPLRQVRFPGAARDFSPRVNFQCRLSHGVRIPPCSTACNNICAHVKDPVVHVKVRWTMKTLKHPACTVGWVGRLCHSWLFPGNATRIFYWNDTGVN